MRRLEIVKVRTLESERVRHHLIELALSLAGTQGLVSAEIYTGLIYHTDAAIHLLWEEEGQPLQVSRVALGIAEKLKEFGLVDHSVWRNEQKT